MNTPYLISCILVCMYFQCFLQLVYIIFSNVIENVALMNYCRILESSSPRVIHGREIV